jgi:hypothetical protein
MNAATEGLRELRNRPAGSRKRAQNAKKMLFGRNKVNEPLKIKELDFSGAQNELSFQGKNPPSKPITRRKIHHLWGIFLSARPPMSSHIFDGYFTSTCGLGARSLQSFSKCPLSQQRHRSGLGWHHACSTTGCGRACIARTGGLRGKGRQDLISKARPRAKAP